MAWGIKVFLAVVGILAFCIPLSVQAADKCDFSVYNRNKEIFSAKCPTDWCDNGERAPRGIRVRACWPKGATTKNPECPDGYISPLQCYGQGICCKGALGVCDWAPGHEGKLLFTCDDVKKNGVTSAPIKCVSEGEVIYIYDGTAKTCVATKITPVFLCLGSGGCETAVGKIDVSSPVNFVGVVLKLVMGIAGAVALFMLIMAGFQVLTSSGDPQKLQVAKEILVSVLTGLVLIVFSLVLLRAIGVDILGIPALLGQPKTTTEYLQIVK